MLGPWSELLAAGRAAFTFLPVSSPIQQPMNRMSSNTFWTSVFLVAAIGTIIMLHPRVFSMGTKEASGQQPDPKKFQYAVTRSADAAKIITLLAVLPESELPKELMDKAEAVGVFPKVKKETAMFTSTTQGYGVISVRQESGWSVPAFYQFYGGGFGNPFANSDSFGIILLFMSKGSVGWFDKYGLQLSNEKKAIEGPVGSISDAQRRELEGAQILAYAYFNGNLSGRSFGKSFWKSFALNPDNDINKPIYGMKGHEVLAGRKKIGPPGVLPGISAFQEALAKYYGRQLPVRSPALPAP